MFNLNKELEISKNIETILEEMTEREEFNCSGFVGCPENGCAIDDFFIDGQCIANL